MNKTAGRLSLNQKCHCRLSPPHVERMDRIRRFRGNSHSLLPEAIPNTDPDRKVYSKGLTVILNSLSPEAISNIRPL